jgi:hypothetical protein
MALSPPSNSGDIWPRVEIVYVSRSRGIGCERPTVYRYVIHTPYGIKSSQCLWNAFGSLDSLMLASVNTPPPRLIARHAMPRTRSRKANVKRIRVTRTVAKLLILRWDPF